MKTAKAVAVLCIVFSLLVSCNKKSDVKHLSPDEMFEYVQSVIGEEIALVNVDGEEPDNRITYIFNIVSRDIDFEVEATKAVHNLNGLRLGNYKLVITIRYITGIKQHYREESAQLAEKYNVKYNLRNSVSARITVNSYDDIDKLTDFMIVLDRLYAFDIIKPDAIASLTHNEAIYFDSCSVIAPVYSTDRNKRLNREDLKEEIIKRYVAALKSAGRTDIAIPRELLEKYGDYYWNEVT